MSDDNNNDEATTTAAANATAAAILMKANEALPAIDEGTAAYSHVPEHGFSLFLAQRTKTIHFVRHAEGVHNQANQAAGDETPTIYSTPGSERYLDARLTERGIQQCVEVRQTTTTTNQQQQQRLLLSPPPQLVVVSPFTRTLQTAHILFGGKGIPLFLVHDLCRERWGKYTCDKRRAKTEIVQEMAPLYQATNDVIDFDSYGYVTEKDEDWTEIREPDDRCTARAIRMMEWLATRPEDAIAVVTHSSWLKHLFREFGHTTERKDQEKLHRLAGNAEVRSVCLALHRGFYPEGTWHGDTFVPRDQSFRKFRYAPNDEEIASLHKNLGSAGNDNDDNKAGGE